MVDRRSVRRGYDELGEAYADARSGDGPGVDLLSRVLERLPAGAPLLDAGCGPGTPVHRAASEAASAHGLDLSREQLRLAEENAPGTALVQGDLTALPIDDGAFAAVTAFHSLIHVPLGDHRTAVDEFARVLRDDGRLLCSEGPEEWRGSNPDWLGSGAEMQWEIAGADATRRQLRDAGFEVVDEVDVAEEFDDGTERWVLFVARRT